MKIGSDMLSKIFLCAMVGMGTAGCYEEEPQTYKGPVERITLAAYAGDTGLLVFLAQDLGLFRNNGLEVTIKEYEAGKLAADALYCDLCGFCICKQEF